MRLVPGLSGGVGEGVGAAAGSRAPDAPRGPSAHAHLLFVLGEYALDEGTGAWTQTIVDALGLVGFEEKAARKALSRSAADGVVVSRRVGRRARWQLTPSGRETLLAAQERLFAPGPERDWDGEWLLLLTSVPESDRRLRHRLRTSLGWAGFGSYGPGLWISPHPSRADEAREVVRSLGDQVEGTLLHARLDDSAERHRLVAQAWDIAELDARYRAFIERFAAGRPHSPGEALTELLHLNYQWRRLLLADPGLPPTLLPPDWSGERARRLLLDRRANWREIGRTWWEQREAASGVAQPQE
ncbi:PaaX family transcriptional regulator C-terminal domain-containing protein [Streptomyces sp. NBC_00038]|uniref:PaaX family transcriptional regulator n=1 Tax=Streptomyces sp. NBC_00038 TaxID=2903615 RepID=UPI002252B451|nr:PaaX family transcriptional regulator C-terminal domain-containing protein [Streptomyces sp. NBC_00038]MCX5555736.1 PaaX family transcriptional regulator [Streptomyces sp. NBC_00038]